MRCSGAPTDAPGASLTWQRINAGRDSITGAGDLAAVLSETSDVPLPVGALFPLAGVGGPGALRRRP